MPPESLPAGRPGKRPSPMLSSNSAMRRFAAVLSDRKAERRNPSSRIPTASGRGSCPILEACRRCAGRPPDGSPRRPCRRRALQAAVLDSACAGNERQRLDFPTPSGPIKPTMQPAGKSRVTFPPAPRFCRNAMLYSLGVRPRPAAARARRRVRRSREPVSQNAEVAQSFRRELDCKVSRPLRVRIEFDISNSRQPGFNFCPNASSAGPRGYAP